MEMDFDLEKDDGNWGIEVYCEAVLQFQAFVQAHKLNLMHNFINLLGLVAFLVFGPFYWSGTSVVPDLGLCGI